MIYVFIVAFAILMVLLLFAMFALPIYFIARPSKKERGKEGEKTEDADASQSAPTGTRFVRAKVIEKKINHYYYKGLNLPMNVSRCILVFETEEGKTEEYPVPEDFFLKTEEGQEGTLVTINGMFFDFGEGEDLPGDEGQRTDDVADGENPNENTQERE